MAYRAEMVMRDTPEDRHLAGFPRVAPPGIHAEVLEVQAGCRTWGEFEARLLERYGLDDARRLSKRDFMEWVETPRKGRNASTLLWEFEESFTRLSMLDRTVLDTNRVVLFVKLVDVLETDNGLMTDWATVKGVCSRFDKRREWGDEKSSPTGPT